MMATHDRATTPVWPLVVFSALAIAITLIGSGAALGGDLLGSDDMMRMQQVRDLINGTNGWFDVSQKRLLTPEGGAMHWSRLPDLFLAGFVWISQPIVGREMAEGLAVTLWPAFHLGWAFAAIATCLRRLNVPLSGQISGLFIFATSSAMVNYLPGRVDHHGLGLALTLTALACLLSPKMTARSGIVAGVCVASMLTVAIENLPAAVLTIVGFGAAWIVHGEKESVRLRAFGATLIIAGLVTFIFDAPGAGGYRAVCDAYGQSHFVALLVAGAGFTGIGTIMPRSPNWPSRLIAMAIAGGMTAASFALINPACLGDPYARLSGDIRTGWLSVVSEARSLPRVMATDPGTGFYLYGFGLAGLAAAIISLVAAPNGQRFGRASVLVLCVTGFLLSVWQVRGTSLSHAAASIAAGWLIGFLVSRWLKGRASTQALILFAGVLLVSPGLWNVPKYLMDGPDRAATRVDCKSQDAFQAIAAAPRMIVFTPIDLGAPLIYHTRHYASAAPYHRNPSAIEMTLLIFANPAEEARERIARTGATHLLYCPGLSEMETYAKRSPDGFAADLESGNLPNWLIPLTQLSADEEGPIIYTIVFDRN